MSNSRDHNPSYHSSVVQYHHSLICGSQSSQYSLWTTIITVQSVDHNHHSTVCGSQSSQYSLWVTIITVQSVEHNHHSSVCGSQSSQFSLWITPVTINHHKHKPPFITHTSASSSRSLLAALSLNWESLANIIHVATTANSLPHVFVSQL